MDSLMGLSKGGSSPRDFFKKERINIYGLASAPGYLAQMGIEYGGALFNVLLFFGLLWWLEHSREQAERGVTAGDTRGVPGFVDGPVGSDKERGADGSGGSTRNPPSRPLNKDGTLDPALALHIFRPTLVTGRSGDIFRPTLVTGRYLPSDVGHIISHKFVPIFFAHVDQFRCKRQFSCERTHIPIPTMCARIALNAHNANHHMRADRCKRCQSQCAGLPLSKTRFNQTREHCTEHPIALVQQTRTFLQKQKQQPLLTNHNNRRNSEKRVQRGEGHTESLP